MTRHAGSIAVTALVLLVSARAGVGFAADWTRPVEVTHDLNRCISYRARLSGRFLVVEATPAPGWHTFAMDNARRAAEKLAGRKALSMDLPTEITVTGGLAVEGAWFQSPPKDFSRPELRWFSWGFEDRALFAARVRRSGSGTARVAIRGQVCTDTTCRRVDITIVLPLSGQDAEADASDFDLKTLIQAR